MRSLLLLLLAVNVAAAEMILVKDGVPQAEIVLEAKPSTSAQLGAFELNHHVKMITGAEFPVKYGKGTSGKIQIVLGGDNKPVGKEYSSIKFSGNTIKISGSDTPDFRKVNYNNWHSFPEIGQYNGTLFGVYDFLEKYCDVRWYGLTDDATTFTPRKTLAVTVKDNYHSSPTDAFRDNYNSGGRPMMLKVQHYTARDERLMRLRWRNAAFFGQTNHNVYRIYFTHWGKAKKPAYAALFKDRRENYFAQGYKGRMAPSDGFLRREYPNDADMPPGICFSEPEVVDFFANQAVEQWQGKPMVGLPSNGFYQKRVEGKPFFSSVQHQDTQGPCNCPKCLEAAKKGQNYLMWQWIADIANATAKKQPGIGISTLAYQRSLAYPENVKLPENLCVQMCLGVHAWWNPEFYKIQHDQIYKKWMDNKGKRVMTVWLYLYNPHWDSKTRYKHKFFPGVYPRHAGRIAKKMTQDGVRGMFNECEWFCSMLEVYVVNKIFYDPSLDPDQIVDEFFGKFYGKAAPEMKAFYTELEDTYWNWKNYPAEMFGKNSIAERLRGHSLGTGMLNANNNWSLGTAERMKRLSGLLAAAEKKAAGDALVLKRISWIRKGYWDQAVEGRQDYVHRLKVNSMPDKNIVINRVADANGDPSKIDWSKQVSVGDCHSAEDGTTVPGAFTMKLAADNEYLYFDFVENKVQQEPTLWKNYFEVFMSGSNKDEVTQIAMAPTTTHPLTYKATMINDVFHTKSVAIPVKLKQIEIDKKWHWQMSMPISVLGSKDLRRFQMNFRRYTPEHKLAWNKFFASAAEASTCMGFVAIKGGAAASSEKTIVFKEGRIRKEIGTWYLNGGTIEFTADPNVASVKMQKRDVLVSTESISVVQGDTVTIRWKAEGKNLPGCSIQLYNGSKYGGLNRMKTVAAGNGEFVSTCTIPAKTTAFRVVFTTINPIEFKLTAPVVTVGAGK